MGDIKWTRTDPKTWELHNVVQADTPTTTLPPTTTSTTLPEQMFDESYQAAPTYAPAEPSQAAQRREWRKQFRTFDKTLKNPSPGDAVQGIQELLDSGALQMDEDGNVYSSLEHPPGGSKARDRLLGAAREWNDYMRDQAERIGGSMGQYMQQLYQGVQGRTWEPQEEPSSSTEEWRGSIEDQMQRARQGIG